MPSIKPGGGEKKPNGVKSGRGEEKSLVVEKLVLEEDAFVRAELENMRIDARKELDRRRASEFRRNLAQRIRSYSSVSQRQAEEIEKAKSRISAARKVYGEMERGSLRRQARASESRTERVVQAEPNRSVKSTAEMKSLRELIKQNEARLGEIPSICQCRPNVGDPLDSCANNCTFYKNQKGNLF